MLEGYFPGDRGPLDLYAFVDEGNRAELLERGLLPWWTHPDLVVRFFRPLSSATVWFDHAVLGGHPLPMHLHSLFWWIVAVLGVRALHRKALPPRAAWIATFVFAVAPCHALPLSWIANRDALLSLSCGVIGLGFHVAWVKDRTPKHALLAATGFALALFAGEYGLSMFAYVIAIALVDRGPLFRRIGATLTYAVPCAAYLGVRAALGYGTRGSGFYADPFHDPAIFLWLAPRRVATLLLNEWLVLEPDAITWDMPTWALGLAILALAALVLLALRESFATLDAATRSTVSWLLVGSVLALGPVLAVVPAPRVLGTSMIGLAAVVGVVLDGAWFRPTPLRPGIGRELAVLAALGLAFTQLVRGPGEAWLQGRRYRSGSVRFASQIETFAEIAPDAMGESDVVIVRALAGAFFIPFAIGEDGLPRRHRLLAESPHVLARRIDERTLELFSAAEGSLFVAGEGCLFRDLRSPFFEGDRIAASGLDVEILRVTEGRVTGARFTLDRPLEALTLVNETRTIFEVASMPPIGLGMPLDAGETPDD